MKNVIKAKRIEVLMPVNTDTQKPHHLDILNTGLQWQGKERSEKIIL